MLMEHTLLSPPPASSAGHHWLLHGPGKQQPFTIAFVQHDRIMNCNGHEPGTGAPRLRSKKHCQLPASWKAEAIGASMTGAEPHMILSGSYHSTVSSLLVRGELLRCQAHTVRTVSPAACYCACHEGHDLYEMTPYPDRRSGCRKF